MATQVGTLGTVSTLTIAGFTFIDFTNFKMLGGYCAGLNKTTLRAFGATSGYQVPAAKQFKIRAFGGSEATTATTSVNGVLVYSDNDIGVNTSTAFTNPVYMFGSDSQAILGIGGETTPAFLPLFWNIPTGKYITYSFNNGLSGTGGAYIAGYEEA